MQHQSVEDRIRAAGGPISALRKEPFPPMAFLSTEKTTWEAEQFHWRDTAAFLDQSHHMVDLFVTGPDALRLFSDFGVNTFKNFVPGKAKQFVAVAPNGHLVGDGILFHLEDGSFDLVGLPILAMWMKYQAEVGKYDVEVVWDDNSWIRKGAPKLYRYEVQGPAAQEITKRAADSEIPELGFFHMGSTIIAGKKVGMLRHGMAGQPGYEFFGPWEDAEPVKNALREAGVPLGMGEVGYTAYTTLTLESAWISLPVPAIFDAPELEAYRRWLPASHLGSLAGSANFDDISQYYVTPYDMGYGKVVKFDHDFLGRDALEQLSGAPHRTKVTFHWNPEDVLEINRSLLTESQDLPARTLRMPKSRSARFHYDSVSVNGNQVGVSVDTGYLGPDRRVLSIGLIDAEHAATETEVEIVWGEPTEWPRPHVPPHRQFTARARVLPAPYNAFARTQYRWA